VIKQHEHDFLDMWGGSRSRFETAPAVLVKSPDPQFEEKVKDICECYLGALTAEQGERTVCIDEMTGIQALERKYLDQPMRPGQRERKSE